MQSEFDGNVVCHGVELLLFVSMLFVLAIHNSPSILKKFYALVQFGDHCVLVLIYIGQICSS